MFSMVEKYIVLRCVRFGSLADILTSPRHVRFTPNNGSRVTHPSQHIVVLGMGRSGRFHEPQPGMRPPCGVVAGVRGRTCRRRRRLSQRRRREEISFYWSNATAHHAAMMPLPARWSNRIGPVEFLQRGDRRGTSNGGITMAHPPAPLYAR